jgi:hypothetical protein
MTDVLIKYDGCWADEIDLQGFLVMTREEWKTHLSLVKRRYGDSEFTISIGTNEEVNFNDFDDYKESFEIKKITDEESAVLRKFFKATHSYWDPTAKKQVKIDIAENGLIALFRSEKWQWDDLEEEEGEEDDAEAVRMY